MTFQEIARVLRISTSDAERLYKKALFKMRMNTPPELRRSILAYLRELDSNYQQGSF